MTYTSPAPAIDRLLARQAASTKRYAEILATARKALAALKPDDFPLGSPSRHFDFPDAIGGLDDMLVLWPDSVLEARAYAAVSADRELEHASRNDAMLVGE